MSCYDIPPNPNLTSFCPRLEQIERVRIEHQGYTIISSEYSSRQIKGKRKSDGTYVHMARGRYRISTNSKFTAENFFLGDMMKTTTVQIEGESSYFHTNSIYLRQCLAAKCNQTKYSVPLGLLL